MPRSSRRSAGLSTASDGLSRMRASIIARERSTGFAGMVHLQLLLEPAPDRLDLVRRRAAGLHLLDGRAAGDGLGVLLAPIAQALGGDREAGILQRLTHLGLVLARWRHEREHVGEGPVEAPRYLGCVQARVHV